MEEGSSQDEGFSDSEVVYEEDVVEVADLDQNGPPEDELQEEMEDLGMEGDSEAEEAMAVRNDAMTIFQRHTASVFSVSLHPSNTLVCSGGEDNKAFMWRTSDASVLLECTGHKDSVTCTEFSGDGKYLATGDMGGRVKVWGVEDRQPVCSFEASDLEWLHWHPQAHVLVAGTSDGGGWMWRVPSGECKTFQGQTCRNTCGTILPDGRHIGCGYEDGGVRIWSLKECTTVATVSPNHGAPVTSIAAHSDGVLLMTGSEDATARLVNGTSGKVVATLAAGMSPEGADSPSSVEAVAFCPSLPLVLTASLSGAVGVWDIATHKLRHKLQHQAGVTQLYCSKLSPLVFTSCLDGAVRVWDVRGGECVREWWGHTKDILSLAVASDDSIAVSGSDDTTALVFSNQLVNS